MKSHPFLNADWEQIFSDNNLADFDALWDLKTEWFEEPNIRRGGWSGVVKIDLDTPTGKVGVFIKRQENHISKTLAHPFKGIATFQKEFNNLNRLTKHNISTLELLYFYQKGQQAILITKALEGHLPLDSATFHLLEKTDKQALLSKIAFELSAMHQCHFQHNCLYPKHIFATKITGEWDIRFIDLEKLKRTPLKKHAIERDLFTLYRHSDFNWTTKDRVYFFKAYVNEDKLSKKSKKLWYAVEKKLQAKRKAS